MGDAPRILAIIPARAGSKRLPGKNLALLGGRPLINWTIEAAFASGAFARVVVSSDSPEILAAATSRSPDVWVHERSHELATDQAGSMQVVAAVLRDLDPAQTFDAVALLQPTSPLRDAEDIKAACALYAASGGRSVVSVSPLECPLEWCGRIDEQGLLGGVAALDGSSVQGSPSPSFRLNGAIYIFATEHFHASGTYAGNSVKAFVMKRERSVDVDSAEDLAYCEFLLSRRACRSGFGHGKTG